MFKFINQIFILLLSCSGSLARLAKISDHTKCISLKNQPCLARATLFDLNPKELHYNPFMVKIVYLIKALILLMIHLVEFVFQIKQM